MLILAVIHIPSQDFTKLSKSPRDGTEMEHELTAVFAAVQRIEAEVDGLFFISRKYLLGSVVSRIAHQIVILVGLSASLTFWFSVTQHNDFRVCFVLLPERTIHF